MRRRGTTVVVQGEDGRPTAVRCCGGVPSAEDLRVIQQTLRPTSWAMARENAGLSVGQAATLLGWARDALVAIEVGTRAVDAVTRAALLRVYVWGPPAA